jgi:hypothetical protein
MAYSYATYEHLFVNTEVFPHLKAYLSPKINDRCYFIVDLHKREK